MIFRMVHPIPTSPFIQLKLNDFCTCIYVVQPDTSLCVEDTQVADIMIPSSYYCSLDVQLYTSRLPDDNFIGVWE